MDKENFKPQLLSMAFNDLHEAESSDFKWDLPLVKISNGDFFGDVNAVFMDDIQMVEGRFNGTLLQNGYTPEGFKTFAIPAIDTQSFWWHYRKVDSNHLLLFPESRELKCISYNGFHVYTISIKEEYLQKVISQSKYPGILEKFCGEEKVIPLSKRFVYVLNSLLRSISLGIQMEKGSGVSRSLEKQLKEKITGELLRLVYHTEESRYIPIGRERDQTILKAIEYILNSDLQKLSTEELCKKTGIKRRSLEYAFKEYVNVGPKSFIKAFRLNRLRQTLRKETYAVSEAASLHGFTHFGQLSRDYKLLFGELPSTTRKRAQT